MNLSMYSDVVFQLVLQFYGKEGVTLLLTTSSYNEPILVMDILA